MPFSLPFLLFERWPPSSELSDSESLSEMLEDELLEELSSSELGSSPSELLSSELASRCRRREEDELDERREVRREKRVAEDDRREAHHHRRRHRCGDDAVHDRQKLRPDPRFIHLALALIGRSTRRVLRRTRTDGSVVRLRHRAPASGRDVLLLQHGPGGVDRVV